MNKGFFEMLKRGLGEYGYKGFLGNLSRCLGPYGVIFRMSCKALKRDFKPLQGPENHFGYCYASHYVHANHLALVKFVLDAGWDLSQYQTPSGALMAKFLVSKGLLDTTHFFSQVCRMGNKQMIDYCIERRYHDGLYLTYPNSVEILDYLYVERQLPTTCGMWERGFYLRDEPFYIWAMQYQHDPHIAFEHAFTTMRLICAVLEWWSGRNFQNVTLLSRILGYTQLGNTNFMVPPSVCEKLSVPVAKAVLSDCCECGDPDNHEERVVTKKLRI